MTESSTHRAPVDLSPAGWPHVQASDPFAEVDRLFVLRVRAAMGKETARSLAERAELSHGTVNNLLAGKAWPTLQTIARLERALASDLWPGRPLPGIDDDQSTARAADSPARH
ncbi:helix-turn-helix domain-containing protein [Curtobacterium flaccumfaciens]|uniref:helix-turn-helix domain-containing protein n=1 Tax=Curtobacterium flaccumfaciens TaxID=2035 RepID=UPI003F80B2E3